MATLDRKSLATLLDGVLGGTHKDALMGTNIDEQERDRMIDEAMDVELVDLRAICKAWGKAQFRVPVGEDAGKGMLLPSDDFRKLTSLVHRVGARLGLWGEVVHL